MRWECLPVGAVCNADPSGRHASHLVSGSDEHPGYEYAGGVCNPTGEYRYLYPDPDLN